MHRINIVFFGSTSDSVLVLEKLFTFHFLLFTSRICAVVTQPPRPVGRKQTPSPTPVELWAKAHGVTILSFPSNKDKPWLYADESTVADTLQALKADLVVSACYGQKIPARTISASRYGGVNVHPSLLPRWRGADPVPWAILSGDRQTGVTIVTLTEMFDKGRILAQKKIPITDRYFSDPLRTKLFALGAELLIDVLPNVLASKGVALQGSPEHKEPYARRLTREDGFEPWETIQNAFADPNEAVRIERKFRAFSPWPGVWTKIATQARPATQVHSKTEEKRLKILACHLSVITCLVLDTVQLEGKKPVPFSQFSTAYLREA